MKTLETLQIIELVALPLLVWFLERRVMQREERRDTTAAIRKAEKDRMDKMIVRGLKILSDCQYEVIYDLKNGEHNGGLDDCMTEIASYRKEIHDWMIDSAASRK